MEKTKAELENMNTKNLLRYYKAERGRFYDTKYRYENNCCTFDDPYCSLEHRYKEHQTYINLIKSILDNRENIN